jgi:hypothetical protein
LAVRFDRFPDRFSRTGHHRCGPGGRCSARSLSSSSASNSLLVLA